MSHLPASGGGLFLLHTDGRADVAVTSKIPVTRDVLGIPRDGILVSFD
jgi:hypothetical protein